MSQTLYIYIYIYIYICVCVYIYIYIYILYFTTSLLQTISLLSLLFYPIVHDLWSNIPVNIPTLDVLVPVYSAYKNLVISSIGLSRFNRLGSSFSSRTGMSSLG